MKCFRETIRFSLCALGITLIIAGSHLGAEIKERLEIPRFERRSLLNGMELLFVSGSPARIPFVLMIKNGAAFDPVDKAGVTYLMARMMLEKTETLSGEQIRENLERIGARLEMRVDWDALFFYGDASLGRLGETLDILSDIVIRPDFTEATFEQVRSAVVEELLGEEADLEARTETLFRTRLFDGNPYSHPVKGSPESLAGLYLRDIKIQYRRLVLPNQTHLALYHSGEVEDLVRVLGRRWGGWVKREAVPFTFRPASLAEGPQILLMEGPAEHSLFRWGNLAAEKSAREFYDLKVVQQYIMLALPTWAQEVTASSQIRGAAELHSGRMPGCLQLSIQASAEHLLSYYQHWQALLSQLEQGQLDPQRFEEARQMVFLEYKSTLQDPIRLLFRLLDADLYNLGINYLPTLNLRLNRVTPASVQRAVREFLSRENFVMVVAGPVAQLKPHLEALGRLTILN